MSAPATTPVYAHFADGIDAINHAKDPDIARVFKPKRVGFPYIHAAPSAEDVFSPYPGTHKGLKSHTLETFKISAPKRGIWIGIAGFANLDAVACLRSPGAVLADINPNQQVMWDRLLEIVGHCATRQEAVGQLASLPLAMASTLAEGNLNTPELIHAKRLEKNRLGIRNISAEGWKNLITAYLNDSSSWLGSEAAYSHIRTLVEQRAIGYTTLDLMNERQVRQLRDFIDERLVALPPAERISTVYLSNYLHVHAGSEASDFYGRPLPEIRKRAACLEALSSGDTLFIDMRLPLQNRGSSGYQPHMMRYKDLQVEFASIADNKDALSRHKASRKPSHLHRGGHGHSN